jgi:hypothetical protein
LLFLVPFLFRTDLESFWFIRKLLLAKMIHPAKNLSTIAVFHETSCLSTRRQTWSPNSILKSLKQSFIRRCPSQTSSFDSQLTPVSTAASSAKSEDSMSGNISLRNK